MQEDVVLANQMLLHLSELLRLTLNQEQTHEVTLRQELDFLRVYLEIEQTRFQDRLKVKIEAAPETLEARVPNLILQPLVENAIRHAVAPRASETLVVIQSERLNGNLLLLVSDNGDGIAAKNASANGIGLANTRSRLEKLYGAAQEFVLHAAANGGVEASVTIPFRTGSEDSK
jgi:LytS/YehU family sensor histidine kinase